MSEQNIVNCSEHQKKCTDYCTFNFCQEKQLFICPRCIQRKMNHAIHENCLKDINLQKDIIYVIQDIMMKNTDYSYEITQIQKLLNLNQYFINILEKINEETKKQIYLMLQNDQQLFQNILQNNQIDIKNTMQSNQLTDVIKKIIQESIYHENNVYKRLLEELKCVYKDLGNQLLKFDQVVDKDQEQKQLTLTKSIEKQIIQVSQIQEQSLYNRINQLNENSLQIEKEISVNQTQADHSESQDNDLNISQFNQNQVIDLFSSNISNTSQTKKILIQNPIANAQKENKVKFCSENISKDNIQNIQMQQEEYEEEESKNNSSFSSLEQEKKYQNQILKFSTNNQIGNQKQKKLISFNPQLIAQENIGDVSIYCIHGNSKIILLTLNDLPSMLQMYDLNNMRFNDQNIIDFEYGEIIDANISENLQKIAICSYSAAVVYKLIDGKSYQLTTIKKKKIYKVLIDQNDHTIVTYEDQSFSLYHYDNIEPYQEINVDKLDQSSLNYFVKLIEDNIALQLQQNKCLKLINLSQNKCLFSKSEKYSLNCVEINSDRNLIATSGLSDYVTIYSYSKDKKEFNELIKIETGHNDEILQTKFINNDQWIVTISGDCTWKVFDIKTGNTIYYLSNESQSAFIKCEYFLQDQSLVFIDQLGEINVYQLQ